MEPSIIGLLSAIGVVFIAGMIILILWLTGVIFGSASTPVPPLNIVTPVTPSTTPTPTPEARLENVWSDDV